MDCTATHYNVPRWYLGRVLLQHPVFWIGKVCDGITAHLMSACWPLGICHMFSGVLFTKEIDLCMSFCVSQQAADMC